MFKILLVFNDNGLKTDFINGVSQAGNTEVVIVEKGIQALELLNKQQFDLAVTAETLSDMTGIEFIEKLVRVNPMINTAIASDLAEKDFHEATEGLGVLMAVPLNAGKDDACRLMDYFITIMKMNKI